MAKTKTNAGRFSFRKTKKALRKKGFKVKSSKRFKHVTKSAASKVWAGRGKTGSASVAAYGNPPMRNISKTTGWMDADQVRFVKVRGKPIQVFIRRRPRKKK